MPNLSPCLTYPKGNAEQAVQFYVSLFPNSRVIRTTHYGENMPMPAGTVLTIDFELDGARFLALNGGPEVAFNMAVTYIIHCKDQAEVDHYWNAFSGDGGHEIQCGWVRDRFGFCWQVVPQRMLDLIGSPDRAQGNRVMQAMMPMKKLIIADLEAAALEAANAKSA